MRQLLVAAVIAFSVPAFAQSRLGDHPARYDACGRMVEPPVVNGRVDMDALDNDPSNVRAMQLGWELARRRAEERARLGLPPLSGEALRRQIARDSDWVTAKIHREELSECDPAVRGLPEAVRDQDRKMQQLQRQVDTQRRRLDDQEWELRDAESRLNEGDE